MFYSSESAMSREEVMAYDKAAFEMRKSGGSFAGNLGDLWIVADLGNRRRILSAFMDVFDLYMKMADERARREEADRKRG